MKVKKVMWNVASTIVGIVAFVLGLAVICCVIKIVIDSLCWVGSKMLLDGVYVRGMTKLA